MAAGSSEAGASGGAVGGQEGVVLAIGVELGAAEARGGSEVAPGAGRQQDEESERETQQRPREEEEAQSEHA